MNNLEFYLDMDGVLVDLERSVVELLGVDYETFRRARRPGVWEMADDLGMDPAFLWDFNTGIVTHQPAEFYVKMPAYPWARELYDRCGQLGEVNFLTTSILSEGCMAGKWRWIVNFAGVDMTKRLITAKQKFKVAAPHRILIDDKPSNVDEFNAAGGIGILFPSRGNSLNAFEDKPLEYVFSEIERRTKF